MCVHLQHLPIYIFMRYNVICSDTLHLKILCRFISVYYDSGRREQGQTEIETKGKSKGES